MAMVQSDLVAGQKLRALLIGFKDRSGLTYEKLAELASCSRGTAENYIAKAGHRRSDDILASLLSALGVTRDERDEALRLHRLNRSCSPDPATVEWAASAAEADCTVWEMEQFTPAEATVHPAITRSHGLASALNLISSPPSYVLRDHDALLHADISAAARGELAAMITLRGGPSTGKTRSLFEAVHALGPQWAVIRPRSASALRGLAMSGLLQRRRCVLWLNELQAFLGPNGTGLSLDVLRDLFAVSGDRDDGKRRQRQPLVVVATLWPEKLRDATAAGELVSDNRDLLVGSNQWVRWHDVPRDFSRREHDKARALAAGIGDGRLRAALNNPDRIGFAQTLAGGHELLQHYLTAPNHMDQLVLDAAGDARRLGHASPLSLPMLRAIATALWREERGQTSPPSGWFDTAIAYAMQPLRSTRGVQALIPLDNADLRNAEAEGVSYELADYLEHYLRHARRTHTVTDAVWE
ncbi:helix-turn-helix domain-containing protein, partial [Amycolatopsis lurida]|uniref:helix-turn-helix domain-containing protein n=1 Tax=Amycolatopsis lurida TaxID=31959 RepID=UPI003666CEF2